MHQAFTGTIFFLSFQVLACESQDVVFDPKTLCDADINITRNRGSCICICPDSPTLTCQSIQVDVSSNNELKCFWHVNNEGQTSSFINLQNYTSLCLNASEISVSNEDVIAVCQNKNLSEADIVVDVVFKGKELYIYIAAMHTMETTR